MLGNLRKRFHSAKYLYTIQLQRVSPWFMHDKPMVIRWSRGNRRNRRGQTELKTSTKVPGNMHSAELHIEESFDLDVTLYSESSRTRKTGPYGRKELRLVIMAMDDAESTHAIFGALTICLNEFNGLMNHEVKLPIECDNEIIQAVGTPYFYINIRSWYKKSSGGTSISSGVTSTGWTAADHSESDGEVEDLMLTHPEDPVKAFDDSTNPGPKFTDDSINTLVGFAIESVPENAEEVVEQSGGPTRVESVTSPIVGLVETRGDSEKQMDSKVTVSNETSTTSQNHTNEQQQVVEMFENEKQEDQTSVPDASNEGYLEVSEPSSKNTQSYNVPVRNLIKRLSTIKSEGENEEAELPDQTGQSPVLEFEVLDEKTELFATTNEAIGQITELQNQTNEDLYENEDLDKNTGKQYLDKSTENQDLDKNEAFEEKTENQYLDKNTESQDLDKNEGFEETTQEQVVQTTGASSEEMERKLVEVSLSLDSLNEKESASLVTVLFENKEASSEEELEAPPENDKTETKSINLVSYPVSPPSDQVTTENDEIKIETPGKSEIEAEEEEIPEKENLTAPRTPVLAPVWMRWLHCVPGGRLLCCQPVVPREP